VSAEQEFPVGPLPVESLSGDPRSSDCVGLFLARAGRVRPGFAPSDDDLAAIVRVCEQVDGLPLGIELAASRVGVLPPTAIAERLARQLDLPGSGPRDLPERQRTMHSTIAWSHDLLDEPARSLLARLSVFAGGGRLEEIEAVCSAGSGPDDVLEPLSSLVEHSLVRTHPGADGPRFELLDTIRRFADDRLAETADREGIRRRHADAYLALAESAAPFLPGRDQRAWLARLAEDHANLRVATGWLIEVGDTQAALRIVAALWRFWQMGGHLEEGVGIAKQVLAMRGAEAPTRSRLKALEALGGLHYWRAEQDRAEVAYAAQLELARRIGDDRDVADALFNLSFPTFILGQVESSDGMSREARRLYANLGDPDALARVDWNEASTLQLTGQVEPSIPVFERALEQFEASGDLPYAALVLGSIGWGYLRLGDLPKATRYGTRSLLAYHALGDVATTTLTLEAAALHMVVLGREEDAMVVLGAYEAQKRRTGAQPPAMLAALLYGEETAARMAALVADPSFDDARARGAEMSLDEAVDFVARATDDWLATAQ
jgi:tetratricopeptide (TPR) repeat protein